MRLVILVLTCVSLAACGGKSDKVGNDAVAAGFEPPATQAPSPVPGQAHTTALAAYVGHYPDEPLDGVGFFDRTEVATALDGAVTDPKLRRAIIHNEGPRTPIFLAGGRVATWGCEAHDCGDHNWTLLIDPATGKGEVCIHQGGRTLWHAGGPPVARAADCPSQPASPQEAG